MSNTQAIENPNDLQGKYLSFFIETTLYAVELLDVIEIINIQPITSVPNLPCFVKGIINLRGKIIPVLDMRLKFGKPEREYNDKTCIIVISIDDIQIGLIVDSVSEVITSTSTYLCPVPDAADINDNQFIRQILKRENSIVLILDCDQLIEMDALRLS